jgi:hypothetical protein
LQFRFRFRRKKFGNRRKAKRRVAQYEAHEEHFDRRIDIEKNFGRDKGRAPDQDRDNRREMSGDEFVFHSITVLYVCSLAD